MAGGVVEGSGNPVEGATVEVSLDCSSDLDPECRIGTAVTTNSEGRFAARIVEEPRALDPVQVTVRVTPAPGDGYVLGRAEVAGLEGAFQGPPVADTTFVQVVLPPNVVDSRRPVRVQPVRHRTPARPLRADEERFYLSDPSGVVALDQATGRCMWQKGESNSLAGLPYVVVGGIVAMARDATLTAVRAADGEVLWSRDGMPNRSLTASEPSRLYASDGSGVVAYDPNTGAVRWTRALIGSGNPLLAASEAIVCAEILAYVECWEASTGEPIWSRPTQFADWLVITGDRVIVGSQGGWTAMDARTAEVLWEAAIESNRVPVISEDDQLAFACSSGACAAFRMEDGQMAWHMSLGDLTGGPVVDGGMVYVVASTEATSTLFALDAASGAIRERILPDPFDGGGFNFGMPAVGKEFVFLFGGFGNLYVFEKAL